MPTTKVTSAMAKRRAVQFWHLWSGLMVAPVLLVLLLTGAIYLFDRELDQWWYQDAYRTVVTAQTAPHSLAEQQHWLRQQLPQWRIDRVLLPRQPSLAVRWQLQRDDKELLVFVDPYRLQITRMVDPVWTPMAIVRRLHGELLAGPVGGYVIEWASCWTLVMLLSGAWLWWPSLRWPSVRRVRHGRINWRDWHTMPALGSAAALVFLVLTGMPWSTFWGQQFAALSANFSAHWAWIAPSPNFHLPATLVQLAADPHAAHRAHAAPVIDGNEPWLAAQLTVVHPFGSTQAPTHGTLPQHAQPEWADEPADIAVVIPQLARAEVQTFGSGLRIIYPSPSQQAFKISYVPDQAQGQRTIFVDARTGAVLDDIGWSRYSPAAKLVEWGVMTHLGRQYGPLNQWINLMFCCMGMLAIAAALRLSWRRRRYAKWQIPLQAGDRLPRWMQAAFVALALLFPLMLITLPLLWCWQRIAATSCAEK